MKLFDDIKHSLAELIDAVDDLEENQENEHFDSFLVGYSLGFIDGLFDDRVEENSVDVKVDVDEKRIEEMVNSIMYDTIVVIAEELAKGSIKTFIEGTYTFEQSLVLSDTATMLFDVAENLKGEGK